jgi:iron complex transport system ATP-binding protein
MAEGLLVRDLTVRLGGRVVLDRASFSAPTGTVTAVIGPNGAGKSTLVKALVSLVAAGGTATFDGKPIFGLGLAARARLVAYVPQQSRLDAPIDVREVVAQGRFAHAWGFAPRDVGRHPAVDAAIAATDIEHLSERRFTELSHGERRRVLIARALATEAPLLLLDEPTAALDIAHVLALLDLLRALAAAGRTVIVVLHPLGEVLGAADHVVLLAGGQVIATGPPHQLLPSAVLERAFGVRAVPGGGLGFVRAGEGGA